MNNPKISIIIPVYNGSNYLRCAIDCALDQTYRNIEIIVVNDGSIDGGKTEQIALSYGDRIRYIAKPNGGVSSALNCGIANMSGDYFAWLSHDDAYSTSRIQDSVELLLAHDLLGKKCVGFTGGYIMDAAGTKIKDFPHSFDKDRLYTGYEAMNIMTVVGTLYGCCFLIPRQAFEEVGGFDESLRYSQDSLMWYRLFLAGYGLISDDHPNVMSRMHSGQVSQLRRDLFSHDALVIAKSLAEPLAQADDSGTLLKKYIKRITRYECSDAIVHLFSYANEHGYMSNKDRIEMNIYRLWGFFRYRIVRFVKKTLILFRQ